MFDIYTIVDLSYLGDEWKDCYLKFRPFTINDLANIKELDKGTPEEIGNKSGDILSDKFVEGYAMDGGKRIEVTKETVKLFPLGTLLDIINSFAAGLDKKKENKSQTSLEDTESPPSPS